MYTPPPLSSRQKRELLESFSAEECALAIEWLRKRLVRLSIRVSNDAANTPIQNLNLSARALNALTIARLYTVKDILDFGPDQLYYLRSVGPKTLQEIKDAVNWHLESETKAQ